jgi:hypothetical protein
MMCVCVADPELGERYTSQLADTYGRDMRSTRGWRD